MARLSVFQFKGMQLMIMDGLCITLIYVVIFTFCIQSITYGFAFNNTFVLIESKNICLKKKKKEGKKASA